VQRGRQRHQRQQRLIPDLSRGGAKTRLDAIF
jgi:hypothetical protein